MHWTQRTGLSLVCIALMIVIAAMYIGGYGSIFRRVLAPLALLALIPAVLLLIAGSAFDEREGWPDQ